MTEYALYLDDSGHPDSEPYVVVAGYIATKDQWLAFEPQWRTAIDKFGVDYPFHMTDFMHDKKQFSSLKREHILSTLSAIIEKHTLRPFVSTVDVAAYKRVNDEFALEECHGAPFALACRHVGKDIRAWSKCSLWYGDKLHSFVEEGTKHFGQMEEVFKRDKLPALTKVPKDMPQVQPADLLAWEAFNYVRQGSPPRPGKNLARLVRRLREAADVDGLFRESDLRLLCERTNTPRRANLTPESTIVFHNNKKRIRKRTIK